jgi:cytochrome c oxidase cbb3-type subunit I/II
VYNLYKTVKAGELEANEYAEAPAMIKEESHQKEHWHRWIERKPITLLVASLVVVAIGGIIELIPMSVIDENIPKIASVKPYTPLELEGRDIYIREGCYNCHSQMIRPFRSETERYGEYSKSGEFIYDHPFQWGSKRTGPDLHRVGGKYPDSWHFNHMIEPTTISQGSIMPAYPWLLENKLDTKYTAGKIGVMKSLGVPYPKNYESMAVQDLNKQALKIKENLAKDNIKIEGLENTEMIAMIAYLQRLGTDIKTTKK